MSPRTRQDDDQDLRATEADRLEQERPSTDDAGDPEAPAHEEEPPRIRPDASEADLLEQRTAVPEDDEDEDRG
ncbi:hypothetical protein [Microbacterium resistens]|uniref:hypothetical protein n=1 Tax=Microbacterium resistens TaxID=156977 RepID=UPI00366C084B